MTQTVDLGLSLRDYQLPEGLLLKAPSRRIFESFDPEALEQAARLSLQFPQKGGILSKAARVVAGVKSPPPPTEYLIMEAHIDALDTPQSVANELVSIGFEVDGFFKFMPRRFNEHYTMKFKIPRRDIPLRNTISDLMDASIAKAKSLLQGSGTEAYIEAEAYTHNCRRFWAEGPMSPEWDHMFPIVPGQVRWIDPPCTQEEADMEGLSLDVVKRADIHVKITKDPRNAVQRRRLIEAMVEGGFYHVTTWSPNDVCTAQFSRLSHARGVFQRMSKYFDRYGGCVEITLEYASEMWRTAHQTPTGVRLCELPPLITAVA